MSARPKLEAFPLFTNQSMGSTVHSAPTNVQQISKISYDISWTGTPTGSFTVEVSDTYTQYPDGTTNNAGSWTPLPLSSSTATGGQAGNGLIDIQTSALWIRLTYNFVSGSGTMNATISGKVA